LCVHNNYFFANYLKNSFKYLVQIVFLHFKKRNMTKLSVNINKIATLRNSRGGQTPNVFQAAIDVQKFGAQGVTIHPRPDERHIRYQDAYDIRPIITTEYNIEGNPIESFLKMVFDIKANSSYLSSRRR